MEAFSLSSSRDPILKDKRDEEEDRATTATAMTTGHEEEHGEDTLAGGDDSPFYKFRLTTNGGLPPEWPQRLSKENGEDDQEANSLIEQAWQAFWGEATQSVQNCHADEYHWSRWLYPRIFPFAVVVGGVLVLMGLMIPDQETLRAVLTVVLCFAVAPVFHSWELARRRRRRWQCWQEINHGAAARLTQALQRQGMQAVVLVHDHQSSLEQMCEKNGFYVTLWLSNNSKKNDTDYQNDNSTHYCYRVLVHKNGLWRKVMGRYADVPLVRDSLAHLRHPPTVAHNDDWHELWNFTEANQAKLRAFRWASDGLMFFLYPIFGALLVFQQLQKWLWLGVGFASLIVLALACGFCAGKRNRGVVQTLEKDIRRIKQLERSLYRQTGVKKDYRVIVDYDGSRDGARAEECHYVYVFVTEPPLLPSTP